MARRASPAVYDILETIERVQLRTAGRTFAEFQADWEFRFAIQRAIEIISEASRRIPPELKELRPEIQWRRVAGIGSVLRHDYHTISDKVIWDVVQEESPPLKAAIGAIAEALDDRNSSK
jgi:uncharacterized protein with HEPN domain